MGAVPNKFWHFKNISNTEAELWLYGPIADSQWWGDEVTPEYFRNELENLGDIDTITVRINSVGGDVFAATAIYTILKDHKATVKVKIDGLAASAATIVAMAGDVISAPANAMLMIHNPLVMMFGYYNANELEKFMDTLEKVKDAILFAYESKTKLSRDELSAMMDKETWMTAQEAKEKGFVDEILFDESVDSSFTNDGRFMVVNSIAHDLSNFRTKPKPMMVNIPINKKEEKTLEIKNVEDLKKAYPDLCNELEKQAKEEERNRIKSIDDIAASIAPSLVNRAKYEQPMTAQELAFEALKNDAQNGRMYLDNRQIEIDNSNTADVTAGNGDEDKKKAAFENTVNMIVGFINKHRGGENK
jgi:ATP-dependent Clp protease, protease subunit